MTDISKLREGDEIEIVIKAKVVADGTVMTTGGRHPRWFGDEFFPEIAESITVVHPEIVPGKPYVDAAGLLYIGLNHGRVQRIDEGGKTDWYGGEGEYREGNFLPAGLRPAKVVPEP